MEKVDLLFPWSNSRKILLLRLAKFCSKVSSYIVLNRGQRIHKGLWPKSWCNNQSVYNSSILYYNTCCWPPRLLIFRYIYRLTKLYKYSRGKLRWMYAEINLHAAASAKITWVERLYRHFYWDTADYALVKYKLIMDKALTISCV